MKCSDLILYIYKIYIDKAITISYNVFMFIRASKTKNKKTGEVYIKHQLVEAYRSQKGPRQRVVLNLGQVSINKKDWRRLAFELENRLCGQGSLINDAPIEAAVDEILRNYDFYKIRKKKEVLKTDWLKVDLERLSTSNNRSLGPELAADYAWNMLCMDAILKEAGMDKMSINIARAIIFAKLINPSSEASGLKWIKERSSCAEIIDSSLLKLKKDPVYAIGDALYYLKDKVEKSLFKKEQAIFESPSTLYLYDLTNTYFEGTCKRNPAAKRAKSKDKQNGAPLMCLALLIDSRGYPVFSQVYEGNKSEPVTLPEVLDRLEEDSAKILLWLKPTIVADRGIATKENVDLLKERGYQYMVVERSSRENDYTEHFKDLDSFESIKKDEQLIYFKKIEEGPIARLLVASQAKKAREEAMDTLKEKRFLEDANALKTSIDKKNVMLLEKVATRIGRIIGRYPTVAKYYELKVVACTDNKKAADLLILKKDKKREDRQVLTGCYVIETTHKGMDAADILKSYHGLARVEASFSSLKTDLGLRPVYHHKGDRCRAHLFISVLAYHLLNTIELSLRDKGDHRKWSTIREELSTHTRTTVIMADSDGGIHHIRLSSTPEASHQEIYDMLGIKDNLGKVHLKL
ncbi:MAG: IS1634 family transposase [Candidatus Humimicrobiaceae bacterium]